MPACRYILMSQHKTGSRMLCDMLSSHLGLACPHEYLDTPSNNAEWREALDRLSKETGKIAVGHVQAKSATLGMLTDESTKRLLLIRDPHYSALSRLRVEFEKPEGWALDPRRYRAEVNFRMAENERLKAFADAVVTYEEITGGAGTNEMPDVVAGFLCGFFGVPVAPMKTMVRKAPPSFPNNWTDLI